MQQGQPLSEDLGQHLIVQLVHLMDKLHRKGVTFDGALRLNSVQIREEPGKAPRIRISDPTIARMLFQASPE